MSPRLEGLVWACLILLVGAACFEALVAIEVIRLGNVPGEGAFGGGAVFVAALLALLVAATVSVAHAVEARCERRLVWILLAPSGVVYVIARWYTFDPYYLPTLRRYADGGVTGSWISVLSIAAIAAALLAIRFPRGGAVWVSVVLLVSALTAWIFPLGK